MEDLNLSKQHPEVYRQMTTLDASIQTAAREAGLDRLLVELVKIRISQLNGCAFCLRIHTRDALALGEEPDRLAVLPAWWESQYFSPAEKAALALAEEATRLPVPAPRTCDEGALTTEQASVVAWLAVAMNAWNRIAILSHYPVHP